MGGNSLIDLVVFGRAAGLHIEQLFFAKRLPELSVISQDAILQSLHRYQRWENATSGEQIAPIREEMQRIMQEDFGVFRNGEIMANGIKRLNAVGERLAQAKLGHHNHVFNTDRVAALELDNLFATAYATALSAQERTESRGAHSREDYPDRDDQNWIKHILYFQHQNRLDYRPVNMTPHYVEPFLPKARVY